MGRRCLAAKNLIERFREKYRVDGATGCWMWVAACHERGYGRMREGNTLRCATHVAWKIKHGDWPPDNLFMCHKCDRPQCVNPDHLFLGTASENNRDRARKARIGKLGLPSNFHGTLEQVIRLESAVGDLFEPARAVFAVKQVNA